MKKIFPKFHDSGSKYCKNCCKMMKIDKMLEMDVWNGTKTFLKWHRSCEIAVKINYVTLFLK